MDQIDINLFNAWHAISAKVRADRVEQLKRAPRQFRETIRRPLRAWCMCLRASDTRLSAMNCMVEPLPEVALGPDEGTDEIIPHRHPHRLTIPGEALRELMKPITIPWPGEDWKKVAKKCGVSKYMLRGWLLAGTLQSDYRVPARTVGSRGKEVMLVYTPSPIDPNSFDARPPLPIWGSAWQHMWRRLPEEFAQKAVRVPRYRTLNGRQVFRGWKWICPGRVGPDGEYLGCGRTCNRLFGPLSPWTVPEAVNDRLEIEMPDDSGLVGAWSPGFTDPDRGERSFACKQCWGVRHVTLLGADGWNVFVSHLTGGLLYGHEVERPMDEAPQKRRRRYAQRVRHTRTTQERVQAMLLEGLTYKQIAKRLNVSYHHVHFLAKRIYREHDVRGRDGLREMFERPHGASHLRVAR